MYTHLYCIPECIHFENKSHKNSCVQSLTLFCLFVCLLPCNYSNQSSERPVRNEYVKPTEYI